VASRSTALRVILEGDSTHLEKVLGRVDKLSESTFGRIAKYAAGAAAGYASIATAKDAITTTEGLAHATHQLHANFGLATKSAGEWSAIMKSRGTDEQRLAMSFKQFATQIHNARDATDSHSKALEALHAKDQARLDAAAKQGKSLKDLIGLRRQLASAEDAASKKSASQLKAFQDLGISQADLVKHGNDINYMLHAVADGMKNLPPGTDKAAISAKLFGRTWQTIAPLIRDGSKAMDEQLQQADKLGAVMGEKTLRQQEELIKSQRNLKLASLGLKIAFGSAVTPALIHFDQLLTQVATDLHGPGSFDDKMKKVGQDVGPAIRSIRDEFDKELPKIADAAGREAPKVAASFVGGFEHADAWGKLALGAFLITKLGAWGKIFKAAGLADAVAWGKGYAPAVEGEAAAAGVAAGEAATGPSALAAMRGSGRLLGGALMAGVTYEAVKNAPSIADKIGHLIMPLQPGAAPQSSRLHGYDPKRDGPFQGFIGDNGQIIRPPGAGGYAGVGHGGRTGTAVGGPSGYVNPLPGARMGRTDMGVDFSASPGSAVRAIGTGLITAIVPNWYKGQPLVEELLTRGPRAGQFVYYAEQLTPSVRKGQNVAAGERIGVVASSGTGLELGFGAGGGKTLAQATTGYSEGQVTSAGRSFARFVGSLAGGRGGGTADPKGGRTGGSGLTVRMKWKSCELTWYDPALGGTNSGTGAVDARAPTASGELYDPNALTCAAPHHYAFGTLIQFSYGGHTVVCKVNDRGGAISGEHFDLSRAAAASLGILGAGKVKAHYRVPGQSKSIRRAKTPYDSLQNLLGWIDLEQQAGTLTPQQAAQQERQAINQVLPQLHGSDRLRALGTLRGLPKPPKPKPALTPAQLTWMAGRGNLATAYANKNPNAFGAFSQYDRVQRDINNPWLQAQLNKIDRLVAAGAMSPEDGKNAKIKILQGALPYLPDDAKLDVQGAINDLSGGGQGDFYDAIEKGLAHIDAQVRAGDLTPEQGRQKKIDMINGNLLNPNMTDDERLDLRGQLKDLTDSTNDNTDAQKALADQLKNVADELKATREFAQSAAATESGAMARWVTEVISKQMGFGIRGRSLTPSYGAARRA
jgi:rare lipoprotein A